MKKGDSHSKACMAARTKSLDVNDATDKAPKYHVVPKPADVALVIFDDGERITGKLPMIVEKYTGSHLEGQMFRVEINGRLCHCGMNFLREYLRVLERNQEET